MKISVVVTLKESVLDPQGKVIQQTMNNIGFENIKSVRQGKYFDLEIDEESFSKAKSVAEELCKKLLANLVIEEYKIVEKI
ncbi:MAG: phosphoribosylformylglycinamidine synthase [Candidatus Pelagibacter sp. TMED64]|nr:phosphoribosylformylglycinamidine synthase [Candidatus Pelagibacter sp.]OUU63866.1 MAG: phosphoribosylformylglycinamidine synthase [Candidatus Pelagibacter sp. TMED64]